MDTNYTIQFKNRWITYNLCSNSLNSTAYYYSSLYMICHSVRPISDTHAHFLFATRCHYNFVMNPCSTLKKSNVICDLSLYLCIHVIVLNLIEHEKYAIMTKSFSYHLLLFLNTTGWRSSLFWVQMRQNYW